MSGLLALEQVFQNAFDGRHISIHAHGEIQIGKVLAFTEKREGQFQRILVILWVRISYLHHADLRQRVDHDNLGALLLGLLQRGQHSRMVCARVVSKDEDEIGALHIFQRGRSLADAERLYHRNARRLVAHVRAIRKIVRSKLPRK